MMMMMMMMIIIIKNWAGLTATPPPFFFVFFFLLSLSLSLSLSLLVFKAWVMVDVTTAPSKGVAEVIDCRVILQCRLSPKFWFDLQHEFLQGKWPLPVKVSTLYWIYSPLPVAPVRLTSDKQKCQCHEPGSRYRAVHCLWPVEVLA